jgi:nucleoprotein TPR
MAAEVDVRAVATFASLPETTISTILEKPTAELVRSLLHNISIKAQEYDQLKSQKFRLEVELETAVRTSESKVKALKGSVERGLAEVTRIRTELQHSGKSLQSSVVNSAKMFRKCSIKGRTRGFTNTLCQFSRCW